MIDSQYEYNGLQDVGNPCTIIISTTGRSIAVILINMVFDLYLHFV